jgi:hypothetical protein
MESFNLICDSQHLFIDSFDLIDDSLMSIGEGFNLI